MFAVKRLITAAVLAVAAMHAQAVPSLTFSTPTVTAGASVDVDVTVTDIADLFGYGMSIRYDAGLLSVASITSGSFLGTAGTPGFDYVPGDVPGMIDYVFDTLSGTGAGASGTGTLFTIHFNTLAAGNAFLGFDNLALFDSVLEDIAFTATGGTLAILPVVTPPIGTVPEPASLLLLGAGGAALLMRRRVR